MGMLARLGVVLGLDSGEFKQGLESADKALGNFSSKVATVGTVGAAAFAAMTYKALAYSDSIADVAKANDMAISSVMALGAGLAQNGGEAENAGKLIASFTAKVDEAAQGSKDAQTSFSRLGITLKDIGSKDITGLFDQTIEALANMDDTLSRNALAMTMFGKAAKGVDFKGLAEGTAETRQEFMEYAKAVELAAELHDKLDAKANKTIVLFTTAFLPTLNSLYDALAKDKQGMDGLLESATTAGKFIAEIFYNAYTVVMAMGAAITFVGSAIKDFVSGKGMSGVESDLKIYQDRIKELWDNAKGFHNEMKKPTEKEEKSTSKFAGRQTTLARNTDLEHIKQMVEMAKLISVEYERHLKFNLANLKTQGEMAFMTENQKKIQEAINKVADDADQKLNDIQKKREEAAAHANGKDIQDVTDELDNQAIAVRLLRDEYMKLTQAEMESQIQAQSTFEFGWNKAFNQYVEDSENAAKRGQEVFQTVTGNMNAAIDNFVRTGKLSFSNLASSIIRDLIAIQMKAQATRMFSSALGGLFGSKYTPGSDSFMGPMPPKADGGYVNSNTPYMVGERGPEMFIPQGSGTIIPNNRMQSSGGGGQTVNNFTINAIDTKSFEQRLFGSSNAIWAANQYANKSLAAAGGRS